MQRLARPGQARPGYLPGDVSIDLRLIWWSCNESSVAAAAFQFISCAWTLLFSPSRRCNYVGEALKGQPQAMAAFEATVASLQLKMPVAPCAFLTSVRV